MLQHQKKTAQKDTETKVSATTAVQLQDYREASVVQKRLSEVSSTKQASFMPIQRKANTTGLPDSLKSGIENLSGHAMDDVKVHYNSSQPAQLNAHAYAQGNQIHIAPGQEKHLPHEAWHVVQQKQGRVKPTMQMKGKVNVNDDAGLENEADVMGAKATKSSKEFHGSKFHKQANYSTILIQRVQIVKIKEANIDIDDRNEVNKFISETTDLSSLTQLQEFMGRKAPPKLLMKIASLKPKVARKTAEAIPEESDESRMKREMAAKTSAEATRMVTRDTFYRRKDIDSVPLTFFMINTDCQHFISKEASEKFGIRGTNLTKLNAILFANSSEFVTGITQEDIYVIIEDWIYHHPVDLMPYRKTAAPSPERALHTGARGPTASQVAPYISEIVHIALGIPVNAYNPFEQEDYNSEVHAKPSTALIAKMSVEHMELPSMSEIGSEVGKLEVVLKNAAKSLMLGRGVCDDFASLAAALMRLSTADPVHFHHSDAPHNWVTYNRGTKLDAWSYANHGVGGDWGDDYAKPIHKPGSVEMALTAKDVQHGITQAFFQYYEAAVDLLLRHRDSPAFTARIKTNYFLLQHVIGNRFPNTLSALSNFVSTLRMEASDNLKEEMLAHKHSRSHSASAAAVSGGFSKPLAVQAHHSIIEELQEEAVFQIKGTVDKYLLGLEEDKMFLQILLRHEKRILTETVASIRKNPTQAHVYILDGTMEAAMYGRTLTTELRQKKEKSKSPSKSTAIGSPKAFAVSVKNQYESTNALIGRKGASPSRATLSQQDIGKDKEE